MAKKQINIRLDDDEYAVIEQRAAAVGLEVHDYMRQVASDEGNDMRHRFLGAAAYFVEDWGDTFAERFGHEVPGKKAAPGQAAA
ncbi:plasmid mobilization protein [Streptomyces sp. NPDC057694]|uniref:plasmid mobilization protein n=1 Tax=Streptomyces sp. NPDC057694 TaxID=3346216 RepID=UPI0036ABFE7B